MPSAAEGGNGVAKPFGGIKIESLLQLAAINRENERSNASSTSAKAAPLREVLNQQQPDANRRLVPLSLVSPQHHDGHAAGLTSLLNALDPKTIALSDPLHSPAANVHEPSHASPKVRLPGVEDITKRPPKHGKAGVPLAEVLNDESRSPHLSVVLPSSRRASISSTGGRKRRKLSYAANAADKTQLEGPLAKDILDAGSGRKYGGQGITLPKLPETNPRESKRHGLPPVITGLHDPPEESRLIPSINTGDGVWQSIQRKPSHELAFQGAVRSSEGALPEPAAEDTRHRSQSPSLGEEDPSSEREVADGHTQNDGHRTVRTTKGTRKAKSYQRWSKEEGENLLRGVKKYGIGNWKRILDDPGLPFHPDRSAVDLKDRFRRSYPKEYQNAGEFALHERQKGSHDVDAQPVTKRARSKQRGESTAEGVEARSGVLVEPAETRGSSSQAQFKRATRRGRVRFSEQEDSALELGFRRHGPNWQKILIDADLKDLLAGRKRTDLRDRFRNKWPDRFKAAKMDSADTKDMKEVPTGAGEDKGRRHKSGTATENRSVSGISKSRAKSRAGESSLNSASANSSSTVTAAENAAGSSAITSQLPTNLPSALLDDLDLGEADAGFDAGSTAPVFALSRLILDRYDRGVQDRGMPSSLVDAPASTVSVGGTVFPDLHNDAQPGTQVVATPNVATTAGAAGMPLSRMLAGEDDARESMVHPGSIGFIPQLETDPALPSGEEMSSPFEQEIRTDTPW